MVFFFGGGGYLLFTPPERHSNLRKKEKKVTQNKTSRLPFSLLTGILCFLQDDIDVEVTVEIKSGESAFLNLSISSGKICVSFTLTIQYDWSLFRRFKARRSIHFVAVGSMFH